MYLEIFVILRTIDNRQARDPAAVKATYLPGFWLIDTLEVAGKGVALFNVPVTRTGPGPWRRLCGSIRD